MPQALIALFTNLAGIIGGTLNGVLGIAVSMMQKGTQAAFQFHQEGISLARDLGMGLNQANAYTKVLTERTQVLAQKYGVTADAIKAVQRNISETTGKQLLLSNAQAEGFVQANKLVGEQTTNKFMDTIMNGMGGQVRAVQGAISKAYATAAKQGLNAQKFSKTVADNLSMANRLNFRNGIDGITRMAAMAEKFGLNMKSVETAAGQFMELDSAIEHSAHLQMLGGSIGAAFSNPLQNAYESMYDPEAFAKRMEDAMKGMATFDTKKGYATMSAMNQEILRNYAKEMGLNAEEVIANAKKMAEVRYKETAFAGDINKYAGNGKDREARRNFIINNSQVTPEGQLQVNGKNINEITEKEWGDMMAFDGKSDTDILKDQALHLKSIDEAITGNASSVAAAFAKGLALDENAQNIIKHIDSYGKTLQDVSENLGQGAGKALNGILNFVDKNKDTLKDIANGIVKVSKFLADNWKGLLIAIGAWKLLLNPLLGLKLGGNTTVGGKLGAKALGGVKGIGKGILGLHKGVYNIIRHPVRTSRSIIGGVRHIGSAAKGAWGSMSKVTKLGVGAGAVIGAVQGISAAYNYNNEKDQLEQQLHSGAISKQEYNAKLKEAKTARNEGVGEGVGTALGTAIGAFVGGPIGAAVGGWLGGEGGKLIGRHWDSISKAAKGVWDGIKTFAFGIWNAIKDIAMGYLNGIWEVLKGVGEALYDVFAKPFVDIWNNGKEAINNFLNGNIKDGFISLAKTIFVPLFDVIAAPFRAVGDIAKGVWNGIGEVAKGYWNGIKDFAKGAWDGIKQIGLSVWNSFKDSLSEIPIIGRFFKSEEKKASGGIVGGNSYSGDRILTGLNSGEMVLNKDQQAQLFKFIQNASSILTKIGSSNGVTYYNTSNRTSNSSSNNTLNNILSTIFNSTSNVVSSALNTNNSIKTIPFGDNSFRKIPKSDYTEYSYNKGGEISVKDINLNVNGTLKLDTRGFIKDLDVSQLLNDTSFVSQLKELIKQSINSDINGGRLMNDNAVMRGMPAQTTLWGRK